MKLYKISYAPPYTDVYKEMFFLVDAGVVVGQFYNGKTACFVGKPWERVSLGFGSVWKYPTEEEIPSIELQGDLE